MGERSSDRDLFHWHDGQEIHAEIVEDSREVLFPRDLRHALDGIEKAARGIVSQQFFEVTPHDLECEIGLRDSL